MDEIYICRPANHIIKEITKRGDVTQRKNKNTGKVEKRKNEYGPNSMFGWGAQDATIPTLKKDLEDLRKDLPQIIGRIQPHQKNPKQHTEVIAESDEVDALFEAEPEPTRKRKSSAYNKEVQYERRVEQRVENANHRTTSQIGPQKGESPILRSWYEAWSNEHRIGNIGAVPDGFTGLNCPSYNEVEESAAGKVVRHFCKFLKSLF